jgi:hypothetical protein
MVGDLGNAPSGSEDTSFTDSAISLVVYSPISLDNIIFTIIYNYQSHLMIYI